MIDIYYIEDDQNIARSVKDFLGHHGYRVSIYPTIAKAKQALKCSCPALVLADWNMPDGNGNMLCQWIRSNWKELPVIYLTVRGESRDIVTGFRSGADDYVVKPFELDVLLLRIGALLRRTGNVSKHYLSCDAVSIDRKRRKVRTGTEEISLSASEYELLLYLMINKGKTVTREQLLEEVWDSNGNFVNDNTLTVTMKRLREKLHQPACIRTVRSVGYCMEETE